MMITDQHLQNIKDAARYQPIGDGYFDTYGSAQEAVDAAVEELRKALAAQPRDDGLLREARDCIESAAWTWEREKDLLARIATALAPTTQGTDSGLADEACPTCEQTNAAFVCSNGFHRPFGTDRKAVFEEAAKVAETTTPEPADIRGENPIGRAIGGTQRAIAQAIRALAEGAGK